MKRLVLGGAILACWVAVAISILVVFPPHRRKALVMGHLEPAGARAGSMTPHPVQDFTLTDSEGREFDSERLRGQVWIASFFFSTCPSTCRQQNEIARRLSRQWGRYGVKVLSITCDPEVDTPERLNEYAKLFEADPEQWFFLTGPMDRISQIGQESFHLGVGRRSHSDRFVAVDRSGRLRGIYDWHDPRQLEALDQQLELLLQEEPPEDETLHVDESLRDSVAAT
jgi:protein SCO1